MKASDEKHKLRVSGAGRWVKCSSSASREATQPDLVNDAAIEGTAAHDLLERCLLNGVNANQFDGERAKNGTLFDSEMVGYVNDVINFVRKELTTGADLSPVWGVETPVQIKTPKSRVINGTTDLWMYWSKSRVLKILDFKYGYRIVPEKENWQLIGYAWGIVLQLLNAGYELPLEIEMICMQPRPAHRDGPFRRWRINFSEFKRYASLFTLAADNTYDRSNSLSVGPWCTDCAFNTKCEALRNAGLSLIDRYEGEPIDLDLPAEQLAQELEVLKRASSIIDDRCDALETAIMQRMSKGERFPKWSIQQTFTHAQWTTNEMGINIGGLFGVKTHKTVPITPNQAIKAGVPKAVVDQFSRKRPTGMKLINEDPTERAKKVFGND